jgi:hypothetical protein
MGSARRAAQSAFYTLDTPNRRQGAILPNRWNLPGRPPARRRGFGLLTQLVFLVVFGGAFMLLVTAIFAPWAYYMGGHFHPLPDWQGWGRMNVASAGGEYLLFARVDPTSKGSGMHLGTNLTGTAYLCTPKGERFRLSLGGSMPRHLPLDTLGQPIHLYMSNAPGWKTQFLTDRRPYLDFYGKWGDRQLVLDDHKTISRSFFPDGTLHKEHDPNHPAGQEIAHVTLQEGTYAEFEAACPPEGK